MFTTFLPFTFVQTLDRTYGKLFPRYINTPSSFILTVYSALDVFPTDASKPTAPLPLSFWVINPAELTISSRELQETLPGILLLCAVTVSCNIHVNPRSVMVEENHVGNKGGMITPRPWIESTLITSSRWNRNEAKIKGAGAGFENKA